jgi:hypothetical protein
MKTTIAIIALASVLLAGGGASTATELQLRRSAPLVSAPGTIARIHARRTIAVGRKTIGMPCMLTPDVIVAYNWNGPQCRYVDNVIVPYRFARY